MIGQQEAVREMAVALAKKIAGLRVGNILLIGSSGSGKTTLMRAVEDYLRSDPVLVTRSTVVRIHANVLGEDAELGSPGEKLILRLLERARQQLGPSTPVETLLDRAARGLVFVDEVDKIRSTVGDRPNTTGIRAQEALLTLIENEAVAVTCPNGRAATSSRSTRAASCSSPAARSRASTTRSTIASRWAPIAARCSR